MLLNLTLLTGFGLNNFLTQLILNPSHLRGIFFYFYLMKNYIFLILYLVSFFLPEFGSIDLVSVKTLYISLLNTIVLFYNRGNLFDVSKELTPVFYLSVSFFIYGLFSMFYSLNIPETIITSFKYLTFLLSFLSFYIIISSFNNFKIVVPLFISSILFLEILFLFYDLINTPNFSLSQRFMGSGSSSNILISTFSMLYKLPFALYLFNYTKSKFHNFLILFLVVSTVFFILIMGSRAGLILLLLYFICYIFLFFKFKIYRNSLAVLSSILILFFSIFTFSGQNNIITSRASTLTENISEDSSFSYRLELLSSAFDTFLNNPIFGIGLGSYKLESIDSNKFIIKEYTVPYHAHNDYAQILVELGILGLLLYLSIFFVLFYYQYKLIIIFKSTNSYALVFACIISLFAYLFDSLFSFPFSRAVQQIHLSFLFALILLIYRTQHGKFQQTA